MPGWMDETLEKLQAISAAAQGVKLPAAASGALGGIPGAAQDPHAVGKALAELLKQDNSLTQSIAVTISNLSARYPKKAY
jgi:hypothetical protein